MEDSIKNNDTLKTAFGMYLTGFALSKAILEDYAQVVAKIENTNSDEIKTRLMKRADEIFKESHTRLKTDN